MNRRSLRQFRFCVAVLACTAVPSMADELDDVLRKRQREGVALRSIAFTPTGGWGVLSGTRGFFNRNIPDEAHQEMTRTAGAGHSPTCLAFTAKGGWSFLYGKNGRFNRNIPDEAHKKMGEFAAAGHRLQCIAFTPSGGFSIVFEGGFFNRGIPGEAHEVMLRMQKAGDHPKWIAFAPNGGFSIISGKTFFNRNIPQAAHETMVEAKKQGLKQIAFDPEGGWCVLYAKTGFERSRVAVPTQQQLPDELRKILARTKVPGMSIAVVQDSKVVWAKGLGNTRATNGKAVSPSTLFQAASISKPVAALAALRLVEQKTIDLDKPINTQLRSWKIPESALTRENPVTLRRILSHTGGLTVHGFGGYRSNTAVPTIQQILKGQRPANSSPIRVDLKPGQRYRYSGGGYCVAQLLISEKTSGPFATAMNRLVLQPLKMEDSTYQQPLPTSLRSRAASGHLRSGSVVSGEWHVYPEQAAAGLWTTPTDLAKFLIGIQSARAGKKGVLLKPDLARQMLTPEKNSQVGLGLFLSGGPNGTFSHGGANAGFRCSLRGGVSSGTGLVIMTNSDNGGEAIEAATKLVSRCFKLEM